MSKCVLSGGMLSIVIPTRLPLHVETSPAAFVTERVQWPDTMEAVEEQDK